jgi:hypothetical protein
MDLQTEFEFVLPKGFVDDRGNVHREGAMRMATAMDEISPLRDPRVRSNEAYLVIMLIAQVITRLGPYRKITSDMVEGFFAADIAYLQDLYKQINEVEVRSIHATCPNCGHEYDVDVPLLGES